jgi:hypothetical protein
MIRYCVFFPRRIIPTATTEAAVKLRYSVFQIIVGYRFRCGFAGHENVEKPIKDVLGKNREGNDREEPGSDECEYQNRE